MKAGGGGESTANGQRREEEEASKFEKGGQRISGLNRGRAVTEAGQPSNPKALGEKRLHRLQRKKTSEHQKGEKQGSRGMGPPCRSSGE